MTGSDDTLSNDGGPQADIPDRQIEPYWVTFTAAVREIERGLGYNRQDAERTLIQAHGKHMRIFKNSNRLLPPDPTKDYYHADDLKKFVREQRLLSESFAELNEPLAVTSQASASKVGKGGPKLPGWKAGIIAAAAYYLDNEGADLSENKLATFIIENARKIGMEIGSTAAKEYAAAIKKEFIKWRAGRN